MKKLILLISILAFFSHHAMANSSDHGTRGGGNFTAAEFVSLAHEIRIQLTLADAWEKIEVSLETYEKAIELTKVVCASSKKLEFLRSSQFNAYYEPNDKTIFLDCKSWRKNITLGMKVTLFHEYMRSIGLEDSEYKISSKIKKYLPSGNSVTAPIDLRVAIYEGNVEGIYSSVKNGAILDREGFPFICQLVSVDGMRWVEKEVDGEKVLIDSESGPIFSRDEKVSLLYYLKSMGADPNETCGADETAMFKTYDPVIMEALIKIGVNPKIKSNKLSGRGNEPLISFLHGYYNYPNKAYFRLIVKHLLDLGANPKECYYDNSACIDTKFAKGDDELAVLLRKYIK